MLKRKATTALACGIIQDTCYYILDQYFGLDTMANIFDFPTIKNNSAEILGNPFAHQLVLKASKKPLDITIYDIQGQLIYEGNLNGALQLNTTNWKSGVYILQLMEKGKLLGVEKLLRE